MINIRRRLQRPNVTNKSDIGLIRQAHETLGLDFDREEDQEAFRASARNAWRFETRTDDLSAYRTETYIWFARMTLGR